MTFFMEESYHAKILQMKTKRLQIELNRPDLYSLMAVKMSKSQLIITSLIRPSKVCFLLNASILVG